MDREKEKKVINTIVQCKRKKFTGTRKIRDKKNTTTDY